MIDFRYHVVSIVAVFLALALGLFIGATSLRGSVKGDITSRTEAVTHTNATLRGQIHDLNNQVKSANAFDSALEPYALQGRLSGESVVVVSAPGADGSIRDDVTSALTSAGATITGDVRLQDSVLDPQQDEFLGTLADRVAIPGRPLPNASGSVRALTLLAEVLVTKPSTKSMPASDATRVLSAFSAGKLLTMSGTTTSPATLAVLIAAEPPQPRNTTPSPSTDEASLLLTFAHELDASSVGTVVAGAQLSDTQGGLVAAIRDDKSLRTALSTVDDADLPSGVITTVLALAEQAGGRAGNYGNGSGRDGPLPASSGP